MTERDGQTLDSIEWSIDILQREVELLEQTVDRITSPDQPRSQSRQKRPDDESRD